MKHHPQKADKQPLPSRLFRSIAGIWSSRAYGDRRCLHGFSYRAHCPDRLLSRQHDPGAERWQGLRRRDRCVVQLMRNIIQLAITMPDLIARVKAAIGFPAAKSSGSPLQEVSCKGLTFCFSTRSPRRSTQRPGIRSWRPFRI